MKTTFNISEEVLKHYTEAEVYIIVSNYLENRVAPTIPVRVNYDIIITNKGNNEYDVDLF